MEDDGDSDQNDPPMDTDVLVNRCENMLRSSESAANVVRNTVYAENYPAPVLTRNSVDNILPDIESRCDALTSMQSVDKTIALEVLKLYHSMETAYIQMKHDKDHEIERLKHSLAMEQVTHKHADTILTMQQKIEAQDARIGQLEQDCLKLHEESHVYRNALEGLEGMTRGKKRQSF
jgi:hypothetical protein